MKNHMGMDLSEGEGMLVDVYRQLSRIVEMYGDELRLLTITISSADVVACQSARLTIKIHLPGLFEFEIAIKT